MSRSGPPRPRPLPSPGPEEPVRNGSQAPQPDGVISPASRVRPSPRPVPTPGPTVDPGLGTTSDGEARTTDRPRPRPRPRPLPSPRPAVAPPQVEPGGHDDAGYDEWDEYDEAGYDEYDDGEYESDADWVYDDEDEYDGDEPGADQEAGLDLLDESAPSRRRRLLRRTPRAARPRKRPRQRRRLPRVPVAAMRAGIGQGVRRSRTGLRSAATFARHHWSRPAYAYLAIVGIALLITLLFYWHSGFNYDECRLCGLPLVFSVSPWWLLLLPFDVPNWPLFAPLLILLLAAVVNAELVDRYAKRPQPVYPDWQ